MKEDEMNELFQKAKKFMEEVDKNAFLTKSPEEIQKEITEAINMCGNMFYDKLKAICPDDEALESPITRFFVGQFAVLYVQQAAMAGVDLKEYITRLGDSFEQGIKQEEVNRLLEDIDEPSEDYPLHGPDDIDDPNEDEYPLDGPDGDFSEEE